MTESPFEAMNRLNREYERAETMRYAGTYGGIRAIVAMVESGERTAAQVMPRIQEAIAEHDREHAEAWAAHKQRLDELSAQGRVYMDDLRRAIATTPNSSSPKD